MFRAFFSAITLWGNSRQCSRRGCSGISSDLEIFCRKNSGNGWREYRSGEEIPEKEIGEEDGEEGPGHPARSGEGRAKAEQRQHREREEEKGIQGEGGAELAVQEQMGRPQGAAGGASEAGEGAEGAGGVDGGRGRIDEIQHGGGTESGKGEEKMKRKPQFPISTAQYPIAKGQPAGAAGGVLPRRARTVLRSAQVSTFLRGSRRR